MILTHWLAGLPGWIDTAVKGAYGSTLETIATSFHHFSPVAAPIFIRKARHSTGLPRSHSPSPSPSRHHPQPLHFRLAFAFTSAFRFACICVVVPRVNRSPPRTNDTLLFPAASRGTTLEGCTSQRCTSQRCRRHKPIFHGPLSLRRA